MSPDAESHVQDYKMRNHANMTRHSNEKHVVQLDKVDTPAASQSLPWVHATWEKIFCWHGHSPTLGEGVRAWERPVDGAYCCSKVTAGCQKQREVQGMGCVVHLRSPCGCQGL